MVHLEAPVTPSFKDGVDRIGCSGEVEYRSQIFLDTGLANVWGPVIAKKFGFGCFQRLQHLVIVLWHSPVVIASVAGALVTGVAETCCRLSLALFGDIRGRSGSLFNSGKGLNPSGLSKAPFTSPRVHATFVVSHNVFDLKPIS